jgi:hypothetical protein
MISATFSNGVKIEARDQRRTYSHAWYVAGYHRLNNQPWSFRGFANSAKVAEQRMITITAFARPDGVTFEEVVSVEADHVSAPPSSAINKSAQENYCRASLPPAAGKRDFGARE